MFSTFLVAVYNLIDTIWVSGLGPKALAAIGFITPLFAIVIGLGAGIGIGANSVIARCIGAGDKEKAENAGLHSILIAIVISIFSSLFLYLFLPQILVINGAANLLSLSLGYGDILFLCLIGFNLSSVGLSLLRSEGDVKRAMYLMAATAILNMILDPIFIYKLNFGISGAAIATALCSFVSCFVLIYWIWIKKSLYLNLSVKNFHFDLKIVKDILNVTLPSASECLIFGVLVILINYLLVIAEGTSAVAAYAAGMKFIQIALIPPMGIGMALLTVAGAAYGSQNSQKLDDAYKYALKIGNILSLIITIFIFIFAPQLSAVFAYAGNGADLISKITLVIRIISIALIGANISLLASMVLQGVGKSIDSMVLTFIKRLIFQLLSIYTFGFILNMGAYGIYMGVVLGIYVADILTLSWVKVYISRLKKHFASINEENEEVENI